jgi:N-methylhydantoinase A/oxoprolinase/acetone carboxylase beta subunit
MPQAGSSLRVGVDVGGTFTDAVAVDAATRAIVARVKVPTTHSAPGGVAAGIVEALATLLEQPGVDADRIAFIAHSTTQATNALLEGDVARVGVVGLIEGAGVLARRQIAFAPMPLGRGTLASAYRFAAASDDAAIRAAVDSLVADGAQAIVASGAFAVDRPAREAFAAAYARERGAPATAGHEVATLYGLRARTRTAVLNASILPRMIATAAMTDGAVQRAGIAAPLMIMRSDGGVMNVAEVARKPILTMLSGPAAGIAGALLHENVTDGIFIEVGGTSADCSVIRRGLPQLRTARIGRHRTMLRSLDVRTIAIAGGSLVRVDSRVQGVAAITGAGPRSAHIAGLSYAVFEPPERFNGARPMLIEEDGAFGYVAIELADGGRAALTPTCAANLLGYVPSGAFAQGNPHSARLAFELAAARFGCDAEAFARVFLERCALALRATIDELIAEYELDRTTIELVGGGGGAASIVPFTGEAMGLHVRIARDAEVISPVGVALALVRDVVERTIVNPSPADIVRVRREAIDRAVASGADPSLVEVTIEIDPQRNLVRATAQGATPAGTRDANVVDEAAPEQCAAAAAFALHAGLEDVALIERAGGMSVYGRRRVPARGLRAWFAAPARGEDLAVVDRRGVVRSIARGAVLHTLAAADMEAAIAALLERTTAFGDVGRALPSVTLAYGDRLAQLGSFADPAQIVSVAVEEVRGLDPATPVLAIATRANA